MVVKESISRDLLRLLVWFPLRWLIVILPVRLGIAALRAMGDMHYALSRGNRAQFLENLARIKGRDNKDSSYVREYFRNHYIDRLLIFIFPKFGAKEVRRFIEIEGIEHLNNALERGKGVILVHGHFGPVHLPLVSLARLGYRMKQIGLPSDEGLSWVGRNVAFRLRMKYEAKIPAEIIKADSFLRGAFKWLNGNGIIMITGDGTGTENRVGRHGAIDFFGQKVMFPLGPAILAEKTGAELLPMFIVPGEKKLYKIIIEEPLTSGCIGAEKDRDITGKFVMSLENRISQYPGYMHFLDRFTSGGMNIDQKASDN
ncbi:MAG: lysophospholipid acyltransferase family protein [Deltaproteobacteria bacterium]|nr:lysophospholipid acyltransferase family protein [Deltaproteobacteria bacterium]